MLVRFYEEYEFHVVTHGGWYVYFKGHQLGGLFDTLDAACREFGIDKENLE